MYGIIVSLSILISSLAAEKLAKKENKNIEVFWGAIFWTILAGAIGARLYHVVDYWHYYSEQPLNIFAVWQGGLGIIGGIIGGTLALTVYLTIRKENILQWLDIAAMVAPLGQALGRLGNIVNRELMPVAYYEMGLNILLLGILWLAKLIPGKHGVGKLPPGLLFMIYISGYTVIRLLLQPYR
jgi:prolipoprotein diacylglyceryl transferase